MNDNSKRQEARALLYLIVGIIGMVAGTLAIGVAYLSINYYSDLGNRAWEREKTLAKEERRIEKLREATYIPDNPDRVYFQCPKGYQFFYYQEEGNVWSYECRIHARPSFQQILPKLPKFQPTVIPETESIQGTPLHIEETPKAEEATTVKFENYFATSTP